MLIATCKKEDNLQTSLVKFIEPCTVNIWNYQQVDSPSAATPDTGNYQETSKSRKITISSKTYKVYSSNNRLAQYYNLYTNL